MLEENIVSQYLVHSHVRVEEQKDSSSVFPGRGEASVQTNRPDICMYSLHRLKCRRPKIRLDKESYLLKSLCLHFSFIRDDRTVT